MEKKYTIYSIVDEKGDVFYVGVSIDPAKRMYAHINCAMNGMRNPVYQRIRKERYKVEMKILETVTGTPEDAQKKENEWIAHFDEMGVKLTNAKRGETYKVGKLTDHSVISGRYAKAIKDLIQQEVARQLQIINQS